MTAYLSSDFHMPACHACSHTRTYTITVSKILKITHFYSVYECFACMYNKCMAYVLGTHRDWKRRVDPLRLELWMVINRQSCWELNLLQEHSVFLTDL